jgi:hypothetical protein
MRKIVLVTVAAGFATVSTLVGIALGQSYGTSGGTSGGTSNGASDETIVRSTGAEQLVVRGDEAVDIVTQGDIRASLDASRRGFLLLMKYQGKDYTCPVTADGLVGDCNLLYWQR